MCSTPAAASLLGRMQAALQMLAQLLGCVRLQGNSLLPMLRVACQTLTVQGLEVLQLAAVGVLPCPQTWLGYGMHAQPRLACCPEP